MIRLLAIDIDGTLLDSGGKLPAAHVDVLRQTVAEGIEVALVTGRSFHFTKPIADLLPIPLTLVVNNGALVKLKTGETEICNLLSPEVARVVLATTTDLEDSVALVFDHHGGGQIVFERMDWSHRDRRDYFEANRAFITHVAEPLCSVLDQGPIQVMFNGSVAPMRALVGTLRSLPIAPEIAIGVTEYEHRDFSLVDVNAGGCSKGATLARWAARRGIVASEVMAVGDNLNDVEMLDFAGTAVVMGNASDAVKSRGYHLTGSNDAGGLATAIRHHALNREG